jgi:hypothetical protein
MIYKYFTDNTTHFYRVPETKEGENNINILHVYVSQYGSLINRLNSIPDKILYEIDIETFEQKIATAILDLELIDFIP